MGLKRITTPEGEVYFVNEKGDRVITGMEVPMGGERKNHEVKDKQISIFIKLLFMGISIFTILLGWQKKDPVLSIIGACIFVVALLIDLYRTFMLSKKYLRMEQDKSEEFVEKGNLLSKSISLIEGIIILASLVGVLMFQGKEKYYSYPCMIIWIGAILVYFISGVIVGEVTNTPLRFGYGGWKVKGPRRLKR